MALPTSFSNNTNPTGPELDGNFSAVGVLTTIPCAVTGTNTLVMTANANTPTISAYSNYLRVSGVAVATNTGATQARVGTLPLLNVYLDTPSGPVALVGNEIKINCAFTLMYDSALNSGAGGWHLFSTPAQVPSVGGTLTNATLSFVNSTLSTLILSGASLSAPTLIGAVGTLGKLSVGASAASITRILSSTATLIYTLTPAQTSQDQIIALPGVQLGDSVALGVTLAQASAGFTAYVPASGSVAARLTNAGAGTIGAFTTVMRATANGFT